MPIEMNLEAESGILVVGVTGKLTEADYVRFVPEVEALIQRQGKLRILLDMHDFHGWSARALWEDVKFDFKHFSDIERVAMIGEKKWERWMAAFCGPFTSAQIRYLEHSQIPEARAWLQAGRTDP